MRYECGTHEIDAEITRCECGTHEIDAEITRYECGTHEIDAEVVAVSRSPLGGHFGHVLHGFRCVRVHVYDGRAAVDACHVGAVRR